MTTKKYELTNKTKKIDNHILHRIKALYNFDNVKAGDLGGWIEKEENLSHGENAWVFNNACVYEDAYVYGDAHIYDNAHVFGNARIHENACIYDNSLILENTSVCGHAVISGKAIVSGNTHILGHAYILEDAHIYGNTIVYENARISGDTSISGNARIPWDVSKTQDVLVIGPIGSRDDYTTFVNTKDGIMVATGCFKGTIKEFKKSVCINHRHDKYRKQYLKLIPSIKYILNNL